MPEDAPPPLKSRPLNPWLPVAVAAIALAGWQWLETRSQLADTRQEVARRLAEADTSARAEQGALQQLREQVESLQGKLGASEAKLAEFQGQSAALQTLYQELARGREEATLLEIEQALTLAGQQLQLAGNVPAAVLALQSADARLARLDRPQFMPLRKALARDLEKLNLLPFVDLAGLSLRLEQSLQGIDKLPLASHGRPAETAENPVSAPGDSWWRLAAGEIWRELKGLVRIQRFDRDEAVLLAPGQSFFLRENLKLRLLNARLALFAHDQWTFRNELKVADAWLERHFDGNSREVHNLRASLRQLGATNIVLELPNLNDSQAALRTLRNGKEKR